MGQTYKTQTTVGLISSVAVGLILPGSLVDVMQNTSRLQKVKGIYVAVS